ncbi:type II toxin-antitoxin system Phd/YefM family antitoxin [Granulicella mallensis]|uniref:Prevent-host-death family protein n=1 Tax=Granulicella mallensis (strain ATCC BAA-1857 / DSM 23137 / MP5ACTX8) TaxID=682795 RepID=G8NR28_GRAMM|nr:type II toxin-antitoxin system prevent-host-death family antitoxin [Granulicella mallensis]AEU35013.1 prevent-host-death family protein [Granulicella mallensis MP5ACTX8]
MVKTIGAAKFKASCLGLMDEVEAKGTYIVITKKGKPIAKLVPMDVKAEEDPLDFYYVGPGKIHGDITSPLVPLEDYKAYR